MSRKLSEMSREDLEAIIAGMTYMALQSQVAICDDSVHVPETAGILGMKGNIRVHQPENALVYVLTIAEEK